MSVTLSEPPPAVAAEQVDWTADVREGYLVERRRDFPLDSIFGVMRLHRDALEQENGGAAEIFQRSSRTAVGRCRCTQNPLAQEPASGATPDVCVKSFWSLPVGQRVKDALRLLRRPRRSLRTLKKLLAHGVPTARPLAAVTRRNPLSADPDFLIMEYLAGAQNLYEYLAENDTKETHAKVAKSVAGFLRTLAEKKVYHPDLKPGNIMVRERGDELDVWVIDVARVKFGKEPDMRCWIRYLTQLNAGLPEQFTLRDRVRLLRACRNDRLPASRRHSIARAVHEKSLERDTKWDVDLEFRPDGERSPPG